MSMGQASHQCECNSVPKNRATEELAIPKIAHPIGAVIGIDCANEPPNRAIHQLAQFALLGRLLPFCSSLLLRLVVPRPTFQVPNELRNSAFQRGLLFHGRQIAHDLPAQSRSHVPEGRLCPWRISQGQDEVRREYRLTRFFIALDRYFHDGSCIDPQSLPNVAVDRDPVTPSTPRNHRGAQRNSFDCAPYGHERLLSGNLACDIRGNVHVPDQADLIHLAGENME